MGGHVEVPRSSRSVERSDGALVQAIVRDREQGALMELARRYQSQIEAPIVAIFPYDHQAAEEARQDTLLKIWRSVETCDSNLPGWIATVSRNAALNVLRRARRAPLAAEVPETESRRGRVEVDVPERAALRCALAGLSDRERVLVVMRYIEGRSNGEIAGALVLAEESVRSLTSRAVRRFGELFRKCSS